MKALLLCPDAYGGHGGIALFNRELIAALATCPGISEVVVIPRLIVRETEPIPPAVTFCREAAGGKIRFMRTLNRVLGAKSFDLVIYGHIHLLPASLLVQTQSGMASLLITHGIEAWKAPKSVVARHFINSMSAVVSVSNLTRERFLDWSKFPGRSYVLPNAVRLEDFGMRPRNPELTRRYRLEGKRVLLTLGRIVAAERYKGFDEVLEIMPALLREHRDIVYMIGGDGSDRPRLEKKAARLGVADHVVFTGHIPESEKADLYNLADVYVMPSRGEGFGFVFLEAAACGVPVIASKHDGGREALLGGRLGLLVDPSNPAEIEAAINESLLRPKRIHPDLELLSFQSFERNVHAIVREILGTAQRA
ncbi:MAG TPA: glycosyltransferase family 4 protein [Thermoanaerobaculia bacterium]|nr:glycosyltransferase family 4 protein [Thermoanaerobaculia bacterium]